MLFPAACYRDAVPDSRARAHVQHTENLAHEKAGIVARYRETLALVPGALAEVAGRGGQAIEDMTAIMGAIEVGRGQVFISGRWQADVQSCNYFTDS